MATAIVIAHMSIERAVSRRPAATDASGALTGFTFMRKSGNGQFDSSLEATLGTIKALPPPPERFARAAEHGKLCPTFQKL